MFLLDDVVVYSASDLVSAAACEFATLRQLDAKLGRATLEDTEDPLLKRTAALGDAHERRVLDEFVALHGGSTGTRPGGVLEIARPTYSRDSLEERHAETLAALHRGADVVFQGSFFDGRFHGRADFLVRQGEAHAVYDSKLARHAKVTALLQLAAYADQLEKNGIVVDPQVRLILGDGTESAHPVVDLLPVYRERRERLQTMLDEHHGQASAVAWNDPRYLTCGRCDICQAEVAAHRDLLLVAGLRVSQRKKLRAHGIETIEQLADSTGNVPGVAGSTLMRLRAQSQLQVAQDTRPPLPNGQPDVQAIVYNPAPLRALPDPDPGDIFFDFEGDPLWAEAGSTEWGLEYLFGLVERDTEKFVSFRADDRAEERAALVACLDYVAQRRARHPEMHIYHYAAYERTALLRLAGRHGVGEAQVDDLLRAGVLVDLYSTVRQSIQISQPSYSLKKLEPLYMGDDVRIGVTNAADSVIQYAEACLLRDTGDLNGFSKIIKEIEDYNYDDCLSTLRLDGWLRHQADAAVPGDSPTSPHSTQDDEDALQEEEPDPLEEDLRTRAGNGARADRTPDQQAFAMLAAALGYHKREQKPFWWAHFDRLTAPIDDWAITRDVFVIESGAQTSDWAKGPNQRIARRRLELLGDWGPGTTLETGEVHLIHGAPLPHGLVPPKRAIRATAKGTIVECRIDHEGREVVVVDEKLPKDVAEYDILPVAIAPDSGPLTTSIEQAIRDLAASVSSHGFQHHPGLDLIRKSVPNTSSGSLPAVSDRPDGTITAIAEALRTLDRSYVAVQGPPGTGKTYVGARVVHRLADDGWRIGVVAQSHAVVEHFLDELTATGLDPARIGKTKVKSRAPAWATVRDGQLRGFLDTHAGSGCVIGGTAWDFTNRNTVDLGELDLLVIDEAGQFALANALAVSTSAQRLLLLGDPQQLPQVSQGVHPEPVDGSALGWLNDGHATLPPHRGYFLEYSWRMHPALCDRVSTHSYDGRLGSKEPEASRRSLSASFPGVHVVHVNHEGNSVESAEEAAEVVQIARLVLPQTWHDPALGDARAMTADDVLVVAPYNAQVALLRRELDNAGLTEVRVGTVDKFQGQEAPVVIVSMTASSAEDVPRGMEFLLARNRVNVAVSRGKWAAFVVRSRILTHYLPGTPAALGELGAFIHLTR